MNEAIQGHAVIMSQLLHDRAKRVMKDVEECRMRSEVISKWAKYLNKELKFEDFTPIEVTWIKIRMFDTYIQALT